MSAISRARELLRALLHRGREDRDLAEEVRFHIEMETAANEQRGMGAAEARRRALVAFGGVERFSEEVRDEDPRLRPPVIRSLASLGAATIARHRFTMLLMGFFAATALSMTAIGIYGVIAYNVARRKQEIGVRMALGARRGSVLRLVVGQAMRPVALGLCIGLGAALLLARLLRGLLYGVGVHDPLTFVVVTCVLLVVALLAAYLPGRRATRVDPVVALRSD